MSTVLTDSEAKANIAANMQRLLSKKGWTQSDLARATDESDARISLAIRAIKLGSAAFLARVAEALDTTIDDLISSPPPPPKKSRKSA